MPLNEPWVLALAAAFSAIIAVLVVFQAAAAFGEWRTRQTVLRSLKRDDGQDTHDPARAARESVVRSPDDMGDGLLAILAERIPKIWDLHHLLAQSGSEWSLESFLLRSAVVGSVGGVIVFAVSGSAVAAAVFAVLLGFGPYGYIRWKKGRRILRLESQLPDAIDLIARAVRAGHPLSEGLRMAAEEAPDPLAAEFRITFEEQRFGLPFEEALLGLGDRVEVVDIRILITAILVQREVGGNLSEILEQIAETMRARFSLKRQVRVYTAQGRMSGYTLAALPIFVGMVITLINPDYMQTLYQEVLGRALLITAGTLQFIGFLWIRRIVDIRY